MLTGNVNQSNIFHSFVHSLHKSLSTSFVPGRNGYCGSQMVLTGLTVLESNVVTGTMSHSVLSF